MDSLTNQQDKIIDLSTWEATQVYELLWRLTLYEKTNFLKVGKRDIRRMLPEIPYPAVSEAVDELDDKGYITVYGRGRLVVLLGDNNG